MSHGQEVTPKPPLPLPPTSRHRGTTLLSHEMGEVACSNPYLIQPFHIWVISQAGDHFPGYKDWLPVSATPAPPDQHCGGLGGRSTIPASFPLSQEVTLFYPTFLSLIGKLLLCPGLNWGCCSRITAELLLFQAERSGLSWPWRSWVPSWHCLFSWTPLCAAGIVQGSAPSWISEHCPQHCKTQHLVQIPHRPGLLELMVMPSARYNPCFPLWNTWAT